MAKSKKTSKTAASTSRDDFTRTMLDRSSLCFDFDTDQRRMVRDDMKFAFVAGNQWDSHMTKFRANRPCYEFNRIRQLIRRVTGQQLQNKPQIKCRPVESNDVDTAEVYNGMIKNIESQSNAEVAYDTAFQWACGGGFGVIRVVSEYESDSTFDQCLKIKTVYNPLNVYWDPSSKEYDQSDAEFWFFIEDIPLTEFKRRWPNAVAVDFDGPMDQYDYQWWYQDTVRIAEYWYKEDYDKRLYLLNDGSTVEADEFDAVADQAASEGITVVRERTVKCPKIMSVMVCGTGQLEKPTEWGGKMFPQVVQWGDILTIDGHQIYSSMTRFGKDAQRIHNFEMSTMVEVVAKQPNAPLVATVKMIEGLESYYERLGFDDPPVVIYNVDPAAPNAKPTREPMAQFPVALANIAGMMSDELKAVLNIYDASVGNRSNETSGRAIMARQQEGDTANFVYIDNQIKALRRIGQILVDCIPNYYDTERSIRILGEDGGEKFIKINKPFIDPQTGRPVVLNDLSRGKYDVNVTVGKNFETVRMETLDAATSLSQAQGPMGILGQYLLIQNMDVPGLDEVRKAARKLLITQGLLEPGEKDAPPPPPQPNPKDVADAQQKLASADKARADAEHTRVETAILAASAPATIQKADNEAAAGTPPPDFDQGFPTAENQV